MAQSKRMNPSHQNDISRRRLIRDIGLCSLGILSAGGLSNALAVPPIVRPGQPRLKLSLAAYSLRNQLSGNGPGRSIDMFDFIRYCAELGIPGAELTSYYFKGTNRKYFTDIKKHAFLHGVTISGTAVGNSFTENPGQKRDEQIASVKDWIKKASWMSAPHIRVFAGNQNGLSMAQAKKNCIEALEECGELAGRHGIFLGIENHGGIVARPEDLVDIVKSVKSPWVGINLDTGNFHTENPYKALAMCAPWAVNVQLKVEIRPSGKPMQATNMGRIVKILNDVNYQGWVVLEHEKAENPWTTIPDYLSDLKHAIHQG